MLNVTILGAIILTLQRTYAFTSVTLSSRVYQRCLPSVSVTSDDGFGKDGDDESSKQTHIPLGDNDTEKKKRNMLSQDDTADQDLKAIHPNSAKVKRKKKNGHTRYRTNDNRDSLPFLVKVTTPDPYTTNDEMERTARKNTKVDRKRSNELERKKNGGKKKKKVARRNLVGMNGKDSISSSIYKRRDDGTLHQILGEFALDKSTNNGDIIETAGKEYLVQKSRCQYKYSGGRFMMVRKILEVKEIKRVLIEQEIRQIFALDTNDDDGSASKSEDNDLPPSLQ